MSSHFTSHSRDRKINLIAFDPSLRKIGIYIKIGDEEKSKRYEYHSKISRLKVLAQIYNDMAILINRLSGKYNIDVGIIEGYAFSKNSKSITAQAEVGGIVRGILGDCEIPIIEVAPLTWKSDMLGKGNIRLKKSTKAQQMIYLDKVQRYHDRRFDSTDEADAWMMARLVEKIINDEAADTPGIRNIRNRLKDILTAERVLTHGKLFDEGK